MLENKGATELNFLIGKWHSSSGGVGEPTSRPPYLPRPLDVAFGLIGQEIIMQCLELLHLLLCLASLVGTSILCCYDYAMLHCSCYAPVVLQLCSLHIHNAGSKEVASKLRLRAFLCSVQPTHCTTCIGLSMNSFASDTLDTFFDHTHNVSLSHAQGWDRKGAPKSADYASITAWLYSAIIIICTIIIIVVILSHAGSKVVGKNYR